MGVNRSKNVPPTGFAASLSHSSLQGSTNASISGQVSRVVDYYPRALRGDQRPTYLAQGARERPPLIFGHRASIFSGLFGAAQTVIVGADELLIWPMQGGFANAMGFGETGYDVGPLISSRIPAPFRRTLL